MVQAQTYLYVYNPQHLFAYPADAAVVDIHEKESSILGCKPTHPDIQISFYDHYNNQIRDLSRKNLDYDPKLGLIVTMGHKVQHRMLKQITCKAEYKGKIKYMNVVIRFHEEFRNGLIKLKTAVLRKLMQMLFLSFQAEQSQKGLGHSLPSEIL